MVGGFTACGYAVAGSAVADDVRVIDECVAETFRVMAEPAVGTRDDVRRNCGTLTGCVDAVVVVVTRSARLYRRIDQTVIEHASETEAGHAVTGGTIDKCLWMAGDRTAC